MIFSTHNLELFRVIYFKKKFIPQLLAVVLGLSFSIAAVLCTVGLMEGFQNQLMLRLRQVEGDMSVRAKNSFFTVGEDLKAVLAAKNINKLSPSILTQAFIKGEHTSIGAFILAVDPNYSLINPDIIPSEGEIILGTELAKKINKREGDLVSLLLASTNLQGPQIISFSVKKIHDFGVYEKNNRLVYTELGQMQKILNLKGKINNLVAKFDVDFHNSASMKSNIEDSLKVIDRVLEFDQRVLPFWHDYEHILQAVEVEKKTIVLVLQLLIVLALFNALSFWYFTKEKTQNETYLCLALGAKPSGILKVQGLLLVSIWFVSALLSVPMVLIFNWLLKVLPLFKLPAEIYNLDRISLHLARSDWVMVFLMMLLWPLLIVMAHYLLNKNKSVIQGMKKHWFEYQS